LSALGASSAASAVERYIESFVHHFPQFDDALLQDPSG
jgi:hypothetical protein